MSNSSAAPVRANWRNLRSATLIFRVPSSTSDARFLNALLSQTFAAEKFRFPSCPILTPSGLYPKRSSWSDPGWVQMMVGRVCLTTIMSVEPLGNFSRAAWSDYVDVLLGRYNRCETLKRRETVVKAVKVKTNVKAGALNGMAWNRCETLKRN